VQENSGPGGDLQIHAAREEVGLPLVTGHASLYKD
jgi:hypothetical protein